MKNTERHTVDLSGDWELCLDPNDLGIGQRWHTQLPPQKSGTIFLPGCLQEHGFGEPPSINTEWIGSQFDQSFYEDPRYEKFREGEAFRFPYWLQPELRYTGAAWFSREVTIPAHWSNSRIILHLERPHWGTQVWVDGVSLGAQDSLSVPHEYELGQTGAPGTHRIVVRVDNRLLYEVGPNAHSVSDHTQGNWNGIVGTIALERTATLYVQGVEVFPNPRRRTAIVRTRIGNRSGTDKSVRLTVSHAHPRTEDTPAAEATELTVSSAGAVGHCEVRFEENVPLWDEFHPALVDLEIELREDGPGGPVLDRYSLRTGVRAVSRDGKRIAVNDVELSLRGTLECAVFPRTGYPPTDTSSWRRILEQARAFGLNHLRFHSWCPPGAAFEAADEAGFYLQVECPLWANQGASVGTDERLDRWLYAESERIVSRYGNHPSFILFTAGNEPSGRIEEFLSQWVEYWKTRDRRRLYTTGAGWPAVPENDYQNVPAPRIQQWGDGLDSRINARPPETETDYAEICRRFSGPVLSHEIGQWCAFPNFKEMPKYTGYLKPRNFEIFRDSLTRNGMAEQAESFLHASGRLQLLCYKEEIEASLRTKNLSGFQLLGLTDFPGQGTALVGVLDSFWEEKGYCTAEEFREFCGPTVPLARLPKRYYRAGDHLRVPVELSHYGASALHSPKVDWQIVSEEGASVVKGELPRVETAERGLTPLGTIDTDLSVPNQPGRYEVQVRLSEQGITNRWSIWCFPRNLRTPEPEAPERQVHLARRLDEGALEVLDTGGSVLLLADPKAVAGDVEIGFSSIFWNTAWTEGQAPHTLGILCDPDHPALADFPTEYHADWQWWELLHGSAAMIMDELPHTLQPIVQPIDTWFRSHRLATLFEARLGFGRILVSTMDISTDLERRIVARQLRYSILRYMSSPRFAPEASVTAAEIRSLFNHGGSA